MPTVAGLPPPAGSDADPSDPSRTLRCRAGPHHRLHRRALTALRSWQERALERMSTWDRGPFLLSAAPGAGKTIPSLVFARRLLRAGVVRRVHVLCPTTPLTR
jgi:superfamily II DNA or RNA helicase